MAAPTSDPQPTLIEQEIPRELTALLPGGRFVLFDGGGHHLQKTRAAEIASAVPEPAGPVRTPGHAVPAEG